MTAPTTQAVQSLPEPYAEWTDYAKRAGLLDSNGVAPENGRMNTQTAFYAYSAAWNRIYPLLAAHEAEVGRLRTELGKYANVFNWDVDGQGIRRVWLEPESTSPTAYNGFESARAALTQGETK
jgi:hypothetical protein